MKNKTITLVVSGPISLREWQLTGNCKHDLLQQSNPCKLIPLPHYILYLPCYFWSIYHTTIKHFLKLLMPDTLPWKVRIMEFVWNKAVRVDLHIFAFWSIINYNCHIINRFIDSSHPTVHEWHNHREKCLYSMKITTGNVSYSNWCGS